MKWTLWNRQTGEFGPIVTGPDESAIEPHVTDEVAAMEGAWKSRTHQVVDGEPVEK